MKLLPIAIWLALSLSPVADPAVTAHPHHWTEAEALAGTPRTRVWWLYMSVSANGFDDGGLSVHQVLGVVPGPRGESGMPMTRAGW